MKAENLFAEGHRLYVERLRGLHFTVVRVHEDTAELVDQNLNEWIVEVGDTLAIYTPGPGCAEDDVPITEVHFQ